MKPIIRALLAIVATVMWGCVATPTPGTQPEALIDDTLPAVEEGRRLARNYTPRESADAVLRWLDTAGHDSRDYARDLLATLETEYDFDGAPVLDSYLDSVVATYPTHRRCRVYMAVADPMPLGARLAADTVASAPAIVCMRRLYAEAGDTASLNIFNRALRFAASRQPEEPSRSLDENL